MSQQTRIRLVDRAEACQKIETIERKRIELQTEIDGAWDNPLVQKLYADTHCTIAEPELNAEQIDNLVEAEMRFWS
jgi:hypothetical protein